MENLLIEFTNNELELEKLEQQMSALIIDLQKKHLKLQDKNDEIREQIKTSMEKRNIKKYENDFIAITYIAPTTRTTVDSKKLKEKYIDIYNECSKINDVKSSIRISIKNIPKESTNQNNTNVENILD